MSLVIQTGPRDTSEHRVPDQGAVPATRDTDIAQNTFVRGGPGIALVLTTDPTVITLRPESKKDVAAIFNTVIEELEGPPRESVMERRVVVPKDLFFRWLFTRPKVGKLDPYTYHGFFVPKGSVISLRTVTGKHAQGGWTRQVIIGFEAAGDKLGAYGPIPLKRGVPPLGEMRLAQMRFSQRINAQGKVTKENTHLGVTFTNPRNGKLQRAPWKVRVFLKPRKERYQGTTLYVFNATGQTNKIWRLEQERLGRVHKVHQKETGQVLKRGSVGHRFALLKYTMLLGMRGATGRDKARVTRARRALKLTAAAQGVS